MQIYNKLVRDKIPQIIERNEGIAPKTRTLNNEEYFNVSINYLLYRTENPKLNK